REFVGRDPSALILGDNIFYGGGLRALLREANRAAEGATVFAYYVSDPERYGVVAFDRAGRLESIEEKPHASGRSGLPGALNAVAQGRAPGRRAAPGWGTHPSGLSGEDPVLPLRGEAARIGVDLLRVLRNPRYKHHVILRRATRSMFPFSSSGSASMAR
ncbi:MAG TPA: sugar phosphate nucleotidyltransferase, partial [Gemmatimonadales bacterium]|nr:sugar phosphate nucleotidyltransferase [Gemmatimonadales bacterium]